MNNSGKQKTIWLVGASSGIGKEMALQLAAAGHKVIISARREALLTDLYRKYPENLIPLPLDVTDEDSISFAREQLQEICSSLNSFIYNSGVVQYFSSNDQSYYEITKSVYEVNFFGFLRCLDIALPVLKNCQGPKMIAAVSSLSSYLPLPSAEAYGSSKAALSYFLDTLRADLYRQNIDVTIINPGFVDTPMTRKNDFSMPWLWSSEQAASYIVKKLAKHPAEIRFPLPLVLLLRSAALLPKKFFAKHSQFMVKN